MKIQQDKKRIWMAAACFTVSIVTAAFLIKSIFFSEPSGYEGYRLPELAYFTIQTNIFAVFLTAYMGVRVVVPGFNKAGSVIGFMVSCYITVTGVVFWLVLVPMFRFAPELFSVKNIWMHTVTPVFVPVVFLSMALERQIKLQGVLVMLIYPVCYMAFAYIMHALTDVYAYPFLNPEIMGSGIVFVLGLVLIAVLFAGLGLLYRFLWNRRVQTDLEISKEGMSI